MKMVVERATLEVAIEDVLYFSLYDVSHVFALSEFMSKEVELSLAANSTFWALSLKYKKNSNLCNLSVCMLFCITLYLMTGCCVFQIRSLF